MRRPLVPTVVVAALALAGASAARGEDEDMALGSPQAPVTVVEYASPTCPPCARFAKGVFPAFKAKYVDTGQVRFVYRETLVHDSLDRIAFRLARCAGPERYFEVIEAIMAGQDRFAKAPSAALKARRFRAVADAAAMRAGLSADQIRQCLGDAAALKALDDRMARQDAAYDVEATPAFVIDGAPLPTREGAYVELADLDAAIQPRLPRKDPP